MAAIVCHGGLQTCLESQLVESRALTMSFPFTSKPHNPQQNPIDLPFKTSFWDSNSKTQEKHNNKTSDTNTAGWSFLQALSNVSYVSKEPSMEKETVYVHPQAKRSSSAMSQESLELCTEKLGNETGSDTAENNGDGDMDLLCSWPTREQQQQVRPPREEGCLGGLRKRRSQNFPPPLTTMRGSEYLRVRSQREDGRLVLEAIRVPPSASCFQTERSHGRLRLCFLKNSDENFDPQETEASDDDDDDGEGVEEECENDSEKREQAEETEEEEEETEKEDEEGEEMMRTECERPRGCKEGRRHKNKELLNNWGEPLSVAIS